MRNSAALSSRSLCRRRNADPRLRQSGGLEIPSALGRQLAWLSVQLLVLRRDGLLERLSRAAARPNLYRHGDIGGKAPPRLVLLCDSLSNTTITALTAEIRESGRPYTIDCYLRADRRGRPALTSAWSAGGLVRARLGMESASQRILDAMVKKTTPELMARSLDTRPPGTSSPARSGSCATPAKRRASSPIRWLSSGRTGCGFTRPTRGCFSIIRQAGRLIRDSRAMRLPPPIQQRGQRDSGGDALHGRPRHAAAGALDRLERFVRTMREMEIPNPYSVYEWMATEGRWNALGHRAAWNVERSMMALNA